MKAQYKAHMGDDLLVVDSARVSFSNENWYSHNSYVYDNLSTAGYEWGRDWAMVLHCNDEFQLQVRKGIENEVAEIAIESFRQAGRQFNWRCLVDAEAKIGADWAETH